MKKFLPWILLGLVILASTNVILWQSHSAKMALQPQAAPGPGMMMGRGMHGPMMGPMMMGPMMGSGGWQGQMAQHCQEMMRQCQDMMTRWAG